MEDHMAVERTRNRARQIAFLTLTFYCLGVFALVVAVLTDGSAQ
jgi:hypothetical protein